MHYLSTRSNFHAADMFFLAKTLNETFSPNEVERIHSIYIAMTSEAFGTELLDRLKDMSGLDLEGSFYEWIGDNYNYDPYYALLERHGIARREKWLFNHFLILFDYEWIFEDEDDIEGQDNIVRQFREFMERVEVVNNTDVSSL